MTGELPYGLASWYPVVRGGNAPREYFDAAHPRTPVWLGEAWDALPGGERIVLGRVSPPGQRADTRALEKRLSETGHAEQFAVFPGTGGSFTLLPTVDGSALRGGMALLPSGRARGRALWAALRTLTPFGVAQRLGMPEVTVWTKGDADSHRGDLPALPVEGSIAVAAGAPTLNRKIIVRAMDRRGTARSILKIGFSERSDDAIDREAQALESLRDLLPGRAPRLIANGERAGRAWLAQEVLEGRHAGDTLSPAHAALLVELGRVSRDSAPLEEVTTYLDARRHLALLDPGFDPDWHAEYASLLTAIERASEGEPIATSAAHGDFTPWNVLQRRGMIRAFDWEYFSESMPALHDLVHFFIQANVLVKQHSGERIFDDLAAFFQGPARDVVEAADLSAPDVLRSLGLYVLHEGTAAEVQERMRPALFAQAALLRHARRAICRRLTGLLNDRVLPDWLPGHGVHPAEAAERQQRAAA